MGIMSRLGAALGLSALVGGGAQAYDAGRRDLRDLGSWNPPIGNVHEEILTNREEIVGRARDLVKNNPIVAGGIDRLCESVIGARMWPESEPDHEAMGRSIDWSFQFAMKMEGIYRGWAIDPLRRSDVHRKSRIPEMFRTAYRHWIIDGEACAVIKMVKGRGRYQTAVELIDPDRLSNPQGISDEMVLQNGNTIIGGVEITPAGDPVAYHIRKKHPASNAASNDLFTWVRIPRYAPSGRQVFIHAFRHDRADQRRGISRLAAAMTRIKMSDKYSNAELAAALFDSLNIGFIQSAAPTGEVRDAVAPIDDDAGSNYWDSLIDYRSLNKVRAEGVRLWHLLPGEKAEINKPSRPSANYPEFMKDSDRRVSSAIGLSYPHLTQNWADINYSSGRLMRNEMWRGFLEDRELFAQEFATPIWAAVMEESVMLGDIKVPGGPANFYRYYSQLTQVNWMGPGPGYGDPKKEAEANEVELRYNGKTHSMIAADNGVDARRVFIKRAFEKRTQEELGLTDISDTQNTMGPGRPPSGSDQMQGADA